MRSGQCCRLTSGVSSPMLIGVAAGRIHVQFDRGAGRAIGVAAGRPAAAEQHVSSLAAVSSIGGELLGHRSPRPSTAREIRGSRNRAGRRPDRSHRPCRAARTGALSVGHPRELAAGGKAHDADAVRIDAEVAGARPHQPHRALGIGARVLVRNRASPPRGTAGSEPRTPQRLLAANQRATSLPSVVMTRILCPPPGTITTAVPVGLALVGQKGGDAGIVDMLRPIFRRFLRNCGAAFEAGRAVRSRADSGLPHPACAAAGAGRMNSRVAERQRAHRRAVELEPKHAHRAIHQPCVVVTQISDQRPVAPGQSQWSLRYQLLLAGCGERRRNGRRRRPAGSRPVTLAHPDIARNPGLLCRSVARGRALQPAARSRLWRRLPGDRRGAADRHRRAGHQSEGDALRPGRRFVGWVRYRRRAGGASDPRQRSGAGRELRHLCLPQRRSARRRRQQAVGPCASPMPSISSGFVLPDGRRITIAAGLAIERSGGARIPVGDPRLGVQALRHGAEPRLQRRARQPSPPRGRPRAFLPLIARAPLHHWSPRFSR